MTPLLRLVFQSTLPIALLISMTHLVGAENAPGDGFTAGIISSLGLTLQYVAVGYQDARRMVRHFHFDRLVAFGLAVALFAAVLPLFVGEPLFAILDLDLSVPVLGTLRLTRAMLFDVGIYFTVLGGAMTIVDSMGRMIG